MKFPVQVGDMVVAADARGLILLPVTKDENDCWCFEVSYEFIGPNNYVHYPEIIYGVYLPTAEEVGL